MNHPKHCRGSVLPVFHRFSVPRLQHGAQLVQPSDSLFLLLSPPHMMGPPFAWLAPCLLLRSCHQNAWSLWHWGSMQPTPATAQNPAADSHPRVGSGAGNSPLNMLPAHVLPGSAGPSGGSGRDKVVARPAQHIVTFSSMAGS